MKELTLSNGAVTIVDPWVFNWARWISWYPHKQAEFYACTNVSRGKGVCPIRHYLHRLITSAPADLEVDHINHNKLDNREANLRLVTRSQNISNVRLFSGASSRYKGVHWCNSHKRWVAKIKVEGRSKHIGDFTDELAAARAYNTAALAAFGQFAFLNEVSHD